MAAAAILNIETAVVSSRFDHFPSNLVGLKTNTSIEKCLATEIQHGRHLEFRKTDSVLSLSEHFAPKLVEMFRHLEFRKTDAVV